MAKSQTQKTSDITNVRGGSIKRDPMSGRFIEVVTAAGSEKPSGRTVSAVKEASARRSAALTRLANR